MGALVSTLVLWVAAAQPAGPCFVPVDQSAGWKQVVLPADAPSLAAPDDIDQFRPYEAARVFDSDAWTFAGTDEPVPGRLDYRFRMAKGSQRLELEFLEPLRGAKVDIIAYSGGRELPLLRERRVAGQSLDTAWSVPDVDTVVVSVHHHFREKPVVARWKVTRQEVLANDPDVPASFKLGRSLYYRQPENRRIELCQAPGRTLGLELKNLESKAMPVPVNVAPKR
jgi:hypothetical protein